MPVRLNNARAQARSRNRSRSVAGGARKRFKLGGADVDPRLQASNNAFYNSAMPVNSISPPMYNAAQSAQMLSAINQAAAASPGMLYSQGAQTPSALGMTSNLNNNNSAFMNENVYGNPPLARATISPPIGLAPFDVVGASPPAISGNARQAGYASQAGPTPPGGPLSGSNMSLVRMFAIGFLLVLLLGMSYLVIYAYIQRMETGEDKKKKDGSNIVPNDPLAWGVLGTSTQQSGFTTLGSKDEWSSVKINNFDRKKEEDPPLRSNAGSWWGALTGSSSNNSPYAQVGTLSPQSGPSEDKILVLMGRINPSNKHKWQYYTLSNQRNQVKLPVIVKNRDGLDQSGVDELMNGDTVKIVGINDADSTYRVTIYANKTIEYQQL